MFGRKLLELILQRIKFQNDQTNFKKYTANVARFLKRI